MITRTILLAICVAIAAASPARAAEMAHGGSMPSMLETATFSHLGLERLEGRFGGGGQDLNWQGQAWLGSDDDKIWFKSEGAVRRSGRVEDGRHELLYNRAVFTFLDLQAGLRTDLDSKPTRYWAALGAQGILPFFVEYEATVYLSDRGRAAARLALSHDLYFTQKLILRPEIEANFYSQADRGRAVGTGLADLQTGLRLRYEISRKFAPYIGVTYTGMFGETERMARKNGEANSRVQFLFGLRAWY